MHAFLKTGKLGTSSSSGPSNKKVDGTSKQAPKPWVEKYRPKKVSDVVQQEEVVAVLEKSLKGADFPNLLFYGPPGTGKTSTILAAARELFGSDLYRQRVLELNASDERGIQVIRDKVKSFAQNTVSGIRPDGSPCPPFKLVVLDEADSMTHSAQAALRRTMEKQSKTTRFCLICNYVSRIIEPLTSRCSKFRFRPLGEDVIQTRLRDICEKEGVTVEDEALATLINVSEGDLRRAITILQSSARLTTGKALTQAHVLEITGIVPDHFLTQLLEVCSSGDYDKMVMFVEDFIAEGYAGAQILLQIHDLVVEENSLTDSQKASICDKIAVCDHKLLDGADEFLQLLDLCCALMKSLSRVTES